MSEDKFRQALADVGAAIVRVDSLPALWQANLVYGALRFHTDGLTPNQRQAMKPASQRLFELYTEV